MDDFLANTPELCNADQRAFLYSDLPRQQTDNPDGYTTAVAFWTQLLLRALSANVLGPSTLTFTAHTLDSQFTFRGDTPTGLSCIVQSMNIARDLMPLTDFLASTPRRWLGWAVARIPLLPRSIPALVATGSFGIDVDAYVALPVVREKAQRLVDFHYSRIECPLTDNLMDMDGFARRFAHIITDGTDIQVMVKHLEDTRRIVTRQTPASVLIKFAVSQAERISTTPTDTDISTQQVTSTQQLISRQVSQLEHRTHQLDTEIRQALANKHRTLALSKLKLKRHIEDGPLAKRLAALEQITKVVLQLQQTQSDVQLMQAIAAGTRSLRDLNQAAAKHDPDAIFDEWRDEVLKANDLESALASNQALAEEEEGAGIDDSELEAELDALVRQEEEKTLEDLELSAAFSNVSISDRPHPSPPLKQARTGSSPLHAAAEAAGAAGAVGAAEAPAEHSANRHHHTPERVALIEEY